MSKEQTLMMENKVILFFLTQIIYKMQDICGYLYHLKIF